MDFVVNNNFKSYTASDACTTATSTSQTETSTTANASPSRGESSSVGVKANPATIVVPLVAVAFLLMVVLFVKSGTRVVSTPSELRDQWFANNLVAGEAGAHYYPPHAIGSEGEASLARSTTTVGSASSGDWFGETMEPVNLKPHYYPRTFLEQ
jgi:hypothetical protein